MKEELHAIRNAEASPCNAPRYPLCAVFEDPSVMDCEIPAHAGRFAVSGRIYFLAPAFFLIL
jgi:hypothetical protein